MAANPGHGDCEACGARCCRYVVVEISKPTSKADRDEIRWLLAHRAIEVYIDHDDKTWNLQVFNECVHLADDGRCANYDGRFDVCRDYDTETCEASDGEVDATIFRTPADFDAWWEVKREKKHAARRLKQEKRRRAKAERRGKKDARHRKAG